MAEQIDWAALNRERARIIEATKPTDQAADGVHDASGDVAYELMTKARALTGGDPNMPELWGEMQWWIATAMHALGIYPNGERIETR